MLYLFVLILLAGMGLNSLLEKTKLFDIVNIIFSFIEKLGSKIKYIFFYSIYYILGYKKLNEIQKLIYKCGRDGYGGKWELLNFYETLYFKLYKDEPEYEGLFTRKLDIEKYINNFTTNYDDNGKMFMNRIEQFFIEYEDLYNLIYEINGILNNDSYFKSLNFNEIKSKIETPLHSLINVLYNYQKTFEINKTKIDYFE